MRCEVDQLKAQACVSVTRECVICESQGVLSVVWQGCLGSVGCEVDQLKTQACVVRALCRVMAAVSQCAGGGLRRGRLRGT